MVAHGPGSSNSFTQETGFLGEERDVAGALDEGELNGTVASIGAQVRTAVQVEIGISMFSRQRVRLGGCAPACVA